MEACLQVRRQDVQSLFATGLLEMCFLLMSRVPQLFQKRGGLTLAPRDNYPTNLTQPNVSAILPVCMPVRES